MFYVFEDLFSSLGWVLCVGKGMSQTAGDAPAERAATCLLARSVRRESMAKYKRLSVVLSFRTPQCPYGIDYRRVHFKLLPLNDAPDVRGNGRLSLERSPRSPRGHLPSCQVGSRVKNSSVYTSILDDM